MTRVFVLGVGPGDPDGTTDLLGGAEIVFATEAAEPTVLFYAEAWRVERVDLVDAVREISARSGRVVLAVAGDPATDPACLAVCDGLRVAGATVTSVPGVSVAPPRLSPLW
jgi:precorrin-4 methylase